MKLLFKNFATKEIRGNIDTRIEKVKHGKYDGVMLAAAGLKLLSLEKYISKIFFNQRGNSRGGSRSNSSSM